MSCQDCEVAQAPDPTNAVTGLNMATYVRVGPANVLISGCRKHLGELIDKLRAANKKETRK